MNSLFRLLFERLPIIRALNGHKTNISRAILALGSIAVVVQNYYPDLPHISDINATLVLVGGWLGLEVGMRHKAIKSED